MKRPGDDDDEMGALDALMSSKVHGDDDDGEPDSDEESVDTDDDGDGEKVDPVAALEKIRAELDKLEQSLS